MRQMQRTGTQRSLLQAFQVETLSLREGFTGVNQGKAKELGRSSSRGFWFGGAVAAKPTDVQSFH
ncbi:MAG: hypothetical protein JWO13_2074 [Acidobacteriales bacterium]|nr:hypothetical protein [Terriglobales bacterium]